MNGKIVGVAILLLVAGVTISFIIRTNRQGRAPDFSTPRTASATASGSSFLTAPEQDPTRDTDGDGIPDIQEVYRAPQSGKTSIYLPDSDGDGLLDGDEDLNRNGRFDRGTEETDPRNQDTDGDRLEDGFERRVLKTSPLEAGDPAGGIVDQDKDGFPLAAENRPGDPDDSDVDVDDDRFTDGFEAGLAGLEAVSDPRKHPPLCDVNGDNRVDNGDSQQVLTFFAGRESPAFLPANADGNRDSNIDNADAQVGLMFFGKTYPVLPMR